jgi:hypothetical protein
MGITLSAGPSILIVTTVAGKVIAWPRALNLDRMFD